jgi:hypothetical protein
LPALVPPTRGLRRMSRELRDRPTGDTQPFISCPSSARATRSFRPALRRENTPCAPSRCVRTARRNTLPRTTAAFSRRTYTDGLRPWLTYLRVGAPKTDRSRPMPMTFCGAASSGQGVRRLSPRLPAEEAPVARLRWMKGRERKAFALMLPILKISRPSARSVPRNTRLVRLCAAHRVAWNN